MEIFRKTLQRLIPKPNVRAFVTDKRKHINAFISFITYLKILNLFGIDLCESQITQAKRKKVIIARYIMKLVWGILFVTSIFQLFSCMFYATREFLKYVISAHCMLLCSFLTWCYLIKHETKLKKVIKKLLRITNLRGTSSLKNFIMMYYIYLMLIFIMYICSQIYYIALDTHSFVSNKRLPVSWYIEKCVLHVLYFAKHFTGFSVFCFLGLYVIVCRYMVVTLYRHIDVTKTLLKSGTSKDIDMCFWRHNWILSTFQVINSVLSYPIFFSNSYNICGMFYAFIIPKWANVNIEIVSVLILNFLAFTASTFAASAVNEADKIAKMTDLKLLQPFIVSDQQSTKTNIEILWQMCHEQPFALSGWNFFEYTRGLYLAAVGSMITYCLLVIAL